MAQKLWIGRKKPCALSPFILMTDPKRVADPVAAAKNVPEGAAIIYRHFGESNKLEIAKELRDVTFNRDQQLLIGHDPLLAISVGADGVHFRRDPNIELAMLWRQRCPNWVISMAALKGPQNYKGDLNVLDGLLLSAIFTSGSSSAGEPIGVQVLDDVCRQLPVSVFALGGINKNTAKDLSGSLAAGLAGIGGLLA